MNIEDIAKELNEQDWKVLFSFGFSGRAIEVYEIMREQVIIPTIKLNKRGLLDYYRNVNEPNKSSYGINQNGVDFANNHTNELPKELLFGAKVRND